MENMISPIYETEKETYMVSLALGTFAQDQCLWKVHNKRLGELGVT